jgi:hypothetical protein
VSNLFVWGTWALLFLSALAYVWRYSHDIPYEDEWALFVPIITGQQRPTVSWLWQQYWQHRLPLPKLIIHAGQKLGVKDLRVPAFLNVCAVAILALLMIMVAKRLRGHTSYMDAFFPLALLHWGRPEIFLRCLFFFYVIPTVLAGILLLIIVGWGSQLNIRSAVLAGVCLVLLPLCGTPGMVCVLLPILWLGFTGMRKWCSPQPSDVRCGSISLAFVICGLMIVGLYFRNYTFNAVYYLEPADSMGIGLTRAAKLLAISFGMGGGESLWAITGPAVAALMLITAGLLAVIWWNQPIERSRAWGLLLFVFFVVCYALLLGWERPHIVGYYGTFPALGLCAVYYAWGLYASSRIGSIVQTCLFAFTCATLPINTHLGLVTGWEHHHETEGLEQALRDGMPPHKIVRYYRGVFYSNSGATDWLFPLLRSLRDAGCGNFRYMGEDPRFREVSLSLTPTTVKGLTWDRGTARVYGEDSYLDFPVAETRPIAGVRITYVHSSDTGGRPAFRLFWKRSDQKDFPSDQSFPPDHTLALPWMETGPEERTTGTIWIDETIDQLRIHPDDKPCDFKILNLVLIVPANQ